MAMRTVRAVLTTGVLAAACTVASTGCAGGASAAQRGRDQAVQACSAARDTGPASAQATVHAHQAAGLDPVWGPLAQDLGVVAVTRQAFGPDLGAAGGAADGSTALTDAAAICDRLGVTVPVTGAATGSPIG